jgi:hypothetical protein
VSCAFFKEAASTATANFFDRYHYFGLFRPQLMRIFPVAAMLKALLNWFSIWLAPFNQITHLATPAIDSFRCFLFSRSTMEGSLSYCW